MLAADLIIDCVFVLLLVDAGDVIDVDVVVTVVIMLVMLFSKCSGIYFGM